MSRNYWIGLTVIAALAGFWGGFVCDRIAQAPSAYAQTQTGVSIRWEPVHHDSGSRMERAKIPGGWIVRTGGGDAITFVPDGGHSWR